MKRLLVPAPVGAVVRPALSTGIALLLVGCGTASLPVVAPHTTMQSALQTALERNQSGQAESWSDPARGESGTVMPIRTYRSAGGKPCREYDITLDGGPQGSQQRAVACRDDDGVWKTAG